MIGLVADGKSMASAKRQDCGFDSHLALHVRKTIRYASQRVMVGTIIAEKPPWPLHVYVFWTSEGFCGYGTLKRITHYVNGLVLPKPKGELASPTTRA